MDRKIILFSSPIFFKYNKLFISPEGIFKYFRHPNYIGVILEIFALPLMLNSLIAAFVFSLLNGILLNYRIKHEEFFLLKVKQDEGSL